MTPDRAEGPREAIHQLARGLTDNDKETLSASAWEQLMIPRRKMEKQPKEPQTI
jgi:hypothetical protein